eukprot:733273-Heterocapsa_arctica.AAC.1
MVCYWQRLGSAASRCLSGSGAALRRLLRRVVMTASDDGGYVHDFTEVANVSPAQADDYLFWKYEEAESRWRLHTGKPVRAVRRV